MPTDPRLRFDRVDALRGVAIVWMALFHFAFDLNHFGLIEPRQRFLSDPFWTLQRTSIVTLFLLCAGAGQALALRHGADGARFWRRWAQVAGCALLVSAGSALMFPRSWIHFGVLHGIAVMLLLLRFGLARLPDVPLLAVGAALLALPRWLAHPVFDTRWLDWTGLVTRKPVTEDWVPVLPWLGVMVIGFALTRLALARWPALLAGGVGAAARPLAVLGRWSLSFYMLHQPVLIGAVMLYLKVAR